MKLFYLLIFITTYSFAQNEKLAVIVNAKQEDQRDFFNLTAYNPVYFLYHPHKAKAQASFKYKLHSKMNFYAGYTHLLMWDLNADSRPILDVNYNPEIFYRWSFAEKTNLYTFDLIPFGHLSNGKEGRNSRSIDYLAGQFNFRDYVRRDMVLRTSLRLRYLHNFDLQNKHIRDYYGPAELKISLTGFSQGIFDKGELSARLYTGGAWGQDLTKGGQEIGFSFRFLDLDITPSFYLQYFHGYAESLQYFDQKEHNCFLTFP